MWTRPLFSHWIGSPRPSPDQLLSSWICLLAWSQGLKVQQFLFRYWGRESWRVRAMDRTPQEQFLADLSIISAVPVDEIYAMSIHAAMRNVNGSAGDRGSARWLLPARSAGNTRNGYGIQYCSDCLRADRLQYIRRSWRMSWSIACARHQVIMRDACPQCDSPVTTLLEDSGRAMNFEWPRRLRCRECQLPFDTAQHVATLPEDEPLLQLIAQCDCAATTGWVILGNLPIYCQSWFGGVHALCQHLCSEPKVVSVFSTLGIDHAMVQSTQRRFDASVPARRLSVLRAVAAVLVDWPYRFREVFGAIRSTRWSIRCVEGVLPQWLDTEIAQLPNQRRRGVTALEVEAACIALAVSQQRLPNMTTLARALGRQHFPRRFVGLYQQLAEGMTESICNHVALSKSHAATDT